MRESTLVRRSHRERISRETLDWDAKETDAMLLFIEGRQSLNSALLRIILANGRLYLLPSKYPIPFR
jgi:hypothetical protein